MYYDGVSGSLGTMSIPELLQWIHHSNKTGSLTVLGRGSAQRFFFIDGAIARAGSSDHDLTFGQFLVNLGKISDDVLIALLRQRCRTGVMLGKLLATEHLLSEEDVREVLLLKARETLFDLMTWQEGSFEFSDEAEPTPDELELKVPLETLMFEGLRQAKERRRVRQAFPSGGVLVRPRSDDARVAMLQDPQTAPMVALMEMGCATRDIARGLQLPLSEVSGVLYRHLGHDLVIAGFSDDVDLERRRIDELTGQARPGGDLAPELRRPATPALQP